MRALLLVAVPLAAFAGVLAIGHLWLFALLRGLFDFVFGGKDPPLSWQLSPVEERALDHWWANKDPAAPDVDNPATLRRLVALSKAPVSGCR